MNERTFPCGLVLPSVGRVYNFAVRITASGIDWHSQQTFRVIGRSAQEVADVIQRDLALAVDYPFELEVLGPRGGVQIRRFTGWERLIYFKMMFDARQARASAGQLPLFDSSNN